METEAVRYGITVEALDSIIKTIRRQDKVKKLILFGSRAKNNFRKGSDIDIAIIGGKEFEIGMFEKRLHRKISLHAMKSGIPKDLLTNLANGIVLDGYLEVA